MLETIKLTDMRKLTVIFFVSLLFFALMHVLYAQDITTCNNYSYNNIKELKKTFGNFYADSINAIYNVQLSNYKKEEEHILKTKKLHVIGDVWQRNPIYKKKNGDIYFRKKIKTYPLSQKLEYLYLEDVPLPLPFDLNESKETLKELTFSYCEYIRDTNFSSFDFSDFDSLQYLYFHILGYHMINGVAEFLPPNACYLKLPPNLKSLSYYDDNQINTPIYPKTLEKLELLSCDFVPEQVFELPNLRKLFIRYGEIVSDTDFNYIHSFNLNELDSLGYYLGSYRPLSEKFITMDSLHTISLSIVKEEDVEILSKMPNLDTLILTGILDRKTAMYVLNYMPDNINKLTNIRCLIISAYAKINILKIKEILPNTTVIYRRYGKDIMWNDPNKTNEQIKTE